MSVARRYLRTVTARQTGSAVTVGHGSDLGLDTVDDGPWYTICESHSEMVSHRTLALARYHSADPLGWCEGCRDSLAPEGQQ